MSQSIGQQQKTNRYFIRCESYYILYLYQVAAVLYSHCFNSHSRRVSCVRMFMFWQWCCLLISSIPPVPRPLSPPFSSFCFHFSGLSTTCFSWFFQFFFPQLFKLSVSCIVAFLAAQFSCRTCSSSKCRFHVGQLTLSLGPNLCENYLCWLVNSSVVFVDCRLANIRSLHPHTRARVIESLGRADSHRYFIIIFCLCRWLRRGLLKTHDSATLMYLCSYILAMMAKKMAKTTITSHIAVYTVRLLIASASLRSTNVTRWDFPQEILECVQPFIHAKSWSCYKSQLFALNRVRF